MNWSEYNKNRKYPSLLHKAIAEIEIEVLRKEKERLNKLIIKDEQVINSSNSKK